MSSTYTVNLGLRKPEHRDPETVESWDAVINNNLDLIDAAFGSRSYTAKAQTYIASTDPHSLSLNKLAEALKDVADTGGGGGAVDRKVVLFPEFSGGTFTSTESNNLGTLVTNADVVGNYVFNHYNWQSSEITLQSYEISVQWRVPETWVSWLAESLFVDISTKDTDNTNCKVDVTISKDGIPGNSAVTGIVSAVAEDWYAERLGNALISFSNANPIIQLLGAGDTLNILIKMYSQSNNYVKIGAITIGFHG